MSNLLSLASLTKMRRSLARRLAASNAPLRISTEMPARFFGSVCSAQPGQR
jgi:hypothetical protein